ncbi:MAG TPA: hypothetical protein PKY05_00770 [Fibrobacteria bacterium]|nr:hypothetical protein [Fibrobacteria bacterium]
MLSLKTSRFALVFVGALVAWGCKKEQTPPDPGSEIEMLPPPPQASPPVFRSIAAGADFGLALDSSGKVWAWGRTDQGQTAVPGDLRRVVQIAAGDHFSVALQDDGQVRVWGGSQVCDYKPPSHAVSIAANGHSAFAAVLADGTVQLAGCFADNDKLAKGLRDIRSVALGQGFLVALTRKGELVHRTTWDGDDIRNLRIPSGIKGVKDIVAGAHHVLALKDDGTVLAWGPNFEGENDAPENLGKVAKLGAGYSSSYAILEDGTLRTWGNSKNKEDVFPPDLGRVRDFSSGQYSCHLALDSSGRIFTWGEHPCDQDMPR